MNEERKKLLEAIFKDAADRGIPVPADVIIQFIRDDLDQRLNEITKQLDTNLSYKLPIFTLGSPGLVPPPRETGLILYSEGWRRQADSIPRGYTSGGGGSSGGHALLTLGVNTASALTLIGQILSLNDVFVQLVGDTMSGDLVGTDFVRTRDGTITRVAGLVSSVALTGGRTMTVNRDINNRISSIFDGTRTWTFTRDINGYVTSWAVT